MTDINNSISLDASQAIRELNRLDRSLSQANAVLTDFKVNADGSISTNFDQAARGAERVRQQTRNVKDEIQGAGRQAQNLALSFETIARVVQTQLIISGLNALRDGFFEAADAAQEFQLTIGRINAIADQTETNFDDLQARIQQLSVDIGRDLNQTAEATFEALQNDLGNTAETFELLSTQASDLAIVTGSDLGAAVNALSSVIKVYGEESEDAATASGVLFGAINAGRLTLDELESRLGTVIPLAGRLGISFEQAASAIATISLAGVDAATSQTQLRNVLNKLIKPTEDLQAAFVGLRVDGFEELLERAGGDFVGALGEIADELGNDEEAIARAFNTIRGNLGVFNILANDGRLAADTLNTVQESAQNLTQEVERINQLDARVAEQNAARLQVIFTQLGEDALVLRNNATAAFLGIIDDTESARVGLVSLAGGATVATTAFVALRSASLASTLALTGFAAPFAAVAAGFAAFAAGAAGGLLLLNQYEEAVTGLGSELAQFEIDSLNEVVNQIEAINADNVSDLNAEFENTSTVLNEVLRTSEATARGIIANFREAQESIESLGRNTLDTFAQGREGIINQIEGELDALDKSIASNTRELAAAQQELNDIDFTQRIRDFTDFQKAIAAAERATVALVDSQADIATIGLSDESREAAEAQVRLAQETARTSLRFAEAAGNARLVRQAQDQIRAAQEAEVDLIQRQIDLQRELPRTVLREQLNELQNVNEAQKDSIEEQIARYQELSRQVADGVPREVLQAQFDLIRQELDSITEGLDDFSGADIVERFGLTNLSESVEEQLLNSLNNLDVQWTQSINGLREQLQSQTFEASVRLNAQIDATVLSDQLNQALAGAQQNENPVQGLEQRAEIIQRFAQDQAQAAGDLELAAAQFNADITEATARLREAAQPGLFGGQAENAQAIAEPTLAALENVGNASEQELLTLRTNLAEAIQFLGTATTGLTGELSTAAADDLRVGLEAAFGAVDARLRTLRQQPILGEQQLEEIQNLRDLLNTEATPIDLEVDDSQVREANQQLDITDDIARQAAVATGEIGDAAIGANNEVSSLNSTTGLLRSSADAATQSFRQLEQAARAAAQAAREAASSGGGTSFAANGGIQYFNNGGRGRDTNPAMLADGEFVVNSRASANFLPQLQAVNAGNDPGSTTNSTSITIGDINVVSQGQVSGQTGRDLAFTLERELRKRTIRGL